mmetsp:Transcript_35470/g.52100  ORF Transcript_35470/g.52100 Transcript_35470/m.52100 type:complete len:279 (-) Transcript_35470:1250-2086(-)
MHAIFWRSLLEAVGTCNCRTQHMKSGLQPPHDSRHARACSYPDAHVQILQVHAVILTASFNDSQDAACHIECSVYHFPLYSDGFNNTFFVSTVNGMVEVAESTSVRQPATAQIGIPHIINLEHLGLGQGNIKVTKEHIHNLGESQWWQRARHFSPLADINLQHYDPSVRAQVQQHLCPLPFLSLSLCFCLQYPLSVLSMLCWHICVEETKTHCISDVAWQKIAHHSMHRFVFLNKELNKAPIASLLSLRCVRHTVYGIARTNCDRHDFHQLLAEVVRF